MKPLTDAEIEAWCDAAMADAPPLSEEQLAVIRSHIFTPAPAKKTRRRKAA